MTIPASSCDCERMFSELGDLFEPKHRKIGSELLAALQSLRRWLAAGFKAPSCAQTAVYTNAEMDSEYHLEKWGAGTDYVE